MVHPIRSFYTGCVIAPATKVGDGRVVAVPAFLQGTIPYQSAVTVYPLKCLMMRVTQLEFVSTTDTSDASVPASFTKVPSTFRKSMRALGATFLSDSVTNLLSPGTNRMAGWKSTSVLPCALIHVLAVIVTDFVEAEQALFQVPGP